MTLTQTGTAWLFCPADRPERFEKAAAAADVVILDLEDGVAAKDREAARTALIETRWTLSAQLCASTRARRQTINSTSKRCRTRATRP